MRELPAAERRTGWTTTSHRMRRAWPSTSLLGGGCGVEPLDQHGDAGRLIAHALDWLATVVPAALMIATPVDRRLRQYAASPVIVRGDGREPVDVDGLLRDYDRHGRALDPFAPSRWNQSTRAVVGEADLEPRARAAYADFLAAHGLAGQASMFLRERGRIDAAIVLLRRPLQRAISPSELALLRSCQPFLEHAFVLARRLPAEPGGGRLLDRLTPRELDVARLAAGGATNAAIGHTLGVSVATVKSHMTSVMAKLDVRSRTELVARVAALREPLR